MRIVLLSVVARAACALVCDFIKAWANPVRVVLLGTCICLAFMTGFFFHKMWVSRKEKPIRPPSYVGVPRVVGKGDEKFLDDLFQQQDKKGQGEKNPEAKTGNDVATAESDAKPVRRAELIVDTSRVRRAELVVNRGVLERGELVRPKPR